MSGDTTVIGVDVGGTKVSVALMRDGVLAEPQLQATEQSDGDALVRQLGELIAAELERASEPVIAVGIGIPSVIEWESGRVRASVNVPLRDVPLRDLLHDRLELPVYVDNDANCAALAEAHDDEGRLTVSELVMLTVGTGVGGGIVSGGRIFHGATGGAAELGHMIIGMNLEEDEVPPGGSFPVPGSLEHLAAGRALDHLATRAAASHPDSALGRVLAREGRVAGPDAVSAAHAGDAQAQEVIALLGHRLGVGIANAVNIFDPEVVAVGGGVSAAGELLIGPARESAQRFILPGVGTRTQIRLARSGPQAGVRGAALLAGQESEHRNETTATAAEQATAAAGDDHTGRAP